MRSSTDAREDELVIELGGETVACRPELVVRKRAGTRRAPRPGSAGRAVSSGRPRRARPARRPAGTGPPRTRSTVPRSTSIPTIPCGSCVTSRTASSATWTSRPATSSTSSGCGHRTRCRERGASRSRRSPRAPARACRSYVTGTRVRIRTATAGLLPLGASRGVADVPSRRERASARQARRAGRPSAAEARRGRRGREPRVVEARSACRDRASWRVRGARRDRRRRRRRPRGARARHHDPCGHGLCPHHAGVGVGS